MLVLCESFSNAKAKSLFTPWKLGSAKWFRFGFCTTNSGFDRYFFQLIIPLKSDYNWCNNFALSWVDTVITRT